MAHQKVKRMMAALLASVLVIGSIPNYADGAAISDNNTEAAAGSDALAGASATDGSEFSSEKISHNYTRVSSTYTLAAYAGENLVYPMDEIFVPSTEEGHGVLTTDTKEYGKNDTVLNMEINDTVTLEIDVPESAQYFVEFDYYSYDETVLPATMGFAVNGEYPFYEARNLELESSWADEGEAAYDRYGNQIVSVPEKVMQWESKELKDSTSRYTMPLAVELEKGANTITLNLSEGNLLLGNITLKAPYGVEEYTGSQKAEGNSLIEIQTEDFSNRNDSSIRATCEYNVNLYPYEIKKKIMNTVESASFADAGQKITYEFEVENAGFYHFNVNYSQADKSDFPVFVDIAIDDVIPNTAFKDYPFAYNKNYNRENLEDGDGNYLSVYLEPGTHTISLTISAEPIREVFEKLEEVMNNINDLALEVTKVAGTNMDKYRDFNLSAYIPDVGEKLYGWADELDSLTESMKKYNTSVKTIGAFSSIGVATNQLRSLAKKPNELIYRMTELSSSVNSANQYLANEMDTLNKNNLGIDSIYLFQEDSKDQIPKKTGVLTTVMKSTSRFVTSFLQQAYSTTNTNPDHLQVWVNRSRQHLEIMQKMIDEKFTPATGIEVDLSLMPDQNKLVLANASGDSPDIATGINYSQPFELAIRGALKDLTEFEDYQEIFARYNEGLLVPLTIDDGIYALPETMNFWVLFYREDILNKLGLEVPDTMQEVKDMLPDLQMRGMNFFYPTAGMIAMKNFHGTTPLLYQNGAELYNEDASSAITSEAAVEGFKELTDLFTIYNLPKDIPSFYQHFRNGDLPIGIADFFTYNTLQNAAPEIANAWKIALVPGTVTEDGETVRYTSGGMDDTVMFHSTDEREEQAWEFMKWWSSAEVQTEYGETLQIAYGDEYMWNTANTEAFANLPWKTSDKEVILAQSEWIIEAPRIVGTYMVERELSNAYNKVVADGETLRTTLDEVLKNIDRETERKLEEFGYRKDGKIIKEYRVPTVETVRKILGKTEG